MAERPRAGRGDGVTIAPGRSRGKSIALLAAAVALACVAALVLFGRPPERERAPEEPVAAAPEASAEPAAPAPPPPVAAELPKAPPAPEPEELAAVVAAEAAEPPPVEPAPDPAPPEGTPSGIGLFPPPGTDPIKLGIVVPDDYELPEGYLRHYQVTDDGQELEPILLYHPDYELLDDAGNPIPLPPDRVVPPELAPPGLEIRTLAVPPPRDEGGS